MSQICRSIAQTVLAPVIGVNTCLPEENRTEYRYTATRDNSYILNTGMHILVHA